MLNCELMHSLGYAASLYLSKWERCILEINTLPLSLKVSEIEIRNISIVRYASSTQGRRARVWQRRAVEYGN
jgi:hypothetical protein